MNSASPGDILPRNKSVKFLSQVPVIAIAIAASVLMGILAQGLEIRYLLMAFVLAAGWAVYALLFGADLHSSLPLIALFFVKPLELSFYLVLLLLVFLGVAELLKSEKLKLSIPYPLAFLILLGFGIYSAMRINVPLGYSYFFSTVIVPFVVLLLFNNASLGKESLLRWMQAIVLVAAFVALYGIFVAIRNPLERLGSFWVTAMTINGFYTAAFFFAVTLALHHKQNLWKALYALAALLIFFGMLYTYTRMVILAVAFGMFLFMLKIRAMRYLGLVFVLMLPLVIPSSMSSRIQTGFSLDISLVIRGLAWYLSAQQILRHPLFGLGFSVWSTWYPTVIPLRILYAQHSHNLFLNLMVDMGIIGTGAYLYIIWKLLRAFWRGCVTKAKDIIPYGLWVAMMSLLFACITDIFIQQFSVSILFWITLGLMLAMLNNKVYGE